jgi:hypothetical protein
VEKNSAAKNERDLRDLDHAKGLLALEEKWLQPFDVIDPFSSLRLEGFLSQKPDHRYGAIVISRVDNADAPQLIYATPKLRYPLDKTGAFHFPQISKIDIYEKLDGTNVLAYNYADADGEQHLTYKLRLFPVLRNGNFGNFLDMWQEMLQRYPEIPDLVNANGCSISFELYGSRNLHLMVYQEDLDCAIIFGVDRFGKCRSPAELKVFGVPVAAHHGTLQAGQDPVTEYNRIRADLQLEIEELEDEKLRGAEGTVWYITTASGEQVMFKCKPESVEAIHWKGGISKEGVKATCWNLLEVEDVLTFAALERLLLEEYAQEDIDHFKVCINECIIDVNGQLAFRNQVLEEYAKVGVSLKADKPTVMRTLSTKFAKNEMKKVYTLIARHGL